MVKNLLCVEIYFSLSRLLLNPERAPRSGTRNRLKNETVLKFMERRKCQQFHLASHSFALRPKSPLTAVVVVSRLMLPCYLLKRLHFLLAPSFAGLGAFSLSIRTLRVFLAPPAWAGEVDAEDKFHPRAAGWRGEVDF
jgi:hypothetical protein